MRSDDGQRVALAEGLALLRDRCGRLVLERNGTVVEGVYPIRCFPLSDPQGAVSLCDPEGREVAFLPRLDRLSAPARAWLESEVRRLEFVPVIERILSILPKSEPNTWEVETDRGRTAFTLLSETDVRRLPGHGLLIVDSRGIRFSIPNVRRLDRKSRRLLAPYR